MTFNWYILVNLLIKTADFGVHFQGYQKQTFILHRHKYYMPRLLWLALWVLHTNQTMPLWQHVPKPQLQYPKIKGLHHSVCYAKIQHKIELSCIQSHIDRKSQGCILYRKNKLTIEISYLQLFLALTNVHKSLRIHPWCPMRDIPVVSSIEGHTQ